MMDQRARRARINIALIIVAAAALYLLGNSAVSLWDRDEPRYAQTSRQMLQSGDWVVPRLLDQVRTAKPVFIYWCQAAAMKLLGQTAFAARLPSVLAMLLTLILLAATIWRGLGPRRALWTVFIMASAGLSIAAAKMCLTDAVLLLWITTAQICLFVLYANEKPAPAVAPTLWVAIGLAGLTKGPVVIGVQLTTMIVLAALEVGSQWRSWSRWRDAIRWWTRTEPLMGIVLVALICGPWLYLVEQRNPGFLAASIGHDVLKRMSSGLEGHKGPPGYYLLTIWGTYFPWSLLLPATIVHAWHRRHLPAIRFALAAALGPWVLFEVVQTKLPHYLLPVFPALALLTADMLICASRWRRRVDLNARWLRFHDPAFLRVAVAWAAIVVALAALPWAALGLFSPPPQPALYAMILLPILAVEYGRMTYVHFRVRRPLDAAAVLGIGMFILIAVLYGLYLPRAGFLRISDRVAAVLNDEGATRPGDALMIDYKETSLAFYQGGTIRPERDNRFLERAAPAEWPKWLVLTAEVWNATPAAIRAQFDVISTIHGLNYADGGRIEDVLVVRQRVWVAETRPRASFCLRDTRSSSGAAN